MSDLVLSMLVLSTNIATAFVYYYTGQRGAARRLQHTSGTRDAARVGELSAELIDAMAQIAALDAACMEAASLLAAQQAELELLRGPAAGSAARG